MSSRPSQQIHQLSMRRLRILGTALLAAFLLLGLLPPPAIEGVVTHVATHVAELTGFEKLSALGGKLADALPQPTVASAAPAPAPSEAPVLQTTATCSGTIFRDDNGNGTNDDTIGLSGVSMAIYDDATGALLGTGTSANGSWSVADLPLFTDVAVVVLGKSSLLNDAPLGTDHLGLVQYVNTGNCSDLTTGLLLVSACTNLPLELGTTVWLDDNADGIQNGNEAGIASVTVNLYEDGTNTLVATKVTDANGDFLFTTADGLLPNTAYDLRLDNAADVAAAGPLVDADDDPYSLTLLGQGLNDERDSDATPDSGSALVDVTTGAMGTSRHHFDIGFVPPASIGDTVWIDGNQNGVRDVFTATYSSELLNLGGYDFSTMLTDTTTTIFEEGIPNVTVELYTTGGALVDSTTTDADGEYLFRPVDPLQQYEVRIDTNTLPADVVQVYDENGVGDDASLAPAAGSLAAGEQYMTADFGYSYVVDLSIDKSVDNAQFTTADDIVFTIDVTNNSAVDAPNVAVADVLRAGDDPTTGEREMNVLFGRIFEEWFTPTASGSFSGTNTVHSYAFVPDTPFDPEDPAAYEQAARDWLLNNVTVSGTGWGCQFDPVVNSTMTAADLLRSPDLSYERPALFTTIDLNWACELTSGPLAGGATAPPITITISNEYNLFTHEFEYPETLSIWDMLTLYAVNGDFHLNVPRFDFSQTPVALSSAGTLEQYGYISTLGITNTVHVESGYGRELLGLDSDNRDVVTVSHQGDLEVVKTLDTPGPYEVGQIVAFTVDVTNVGSVPWYSDIHVMDIAESLTPITTTLSTGSWSCADQYASSSTDFYAFDGYMIMPDGSQVYDDEGFGCYHPPIAGGFQPGSSVTFTYQAYIGNTWFTTRGGGTFTNAVALWGAAANDQNFINNASYVRESIDILPNVFAKDLLAQGINTIEYVISTGGLTAGDLAPGQSVFIEEKIHPETPFISAGNGWQCEPHHDTINFPTTPPSNWQICWFDPVANGKSGTDLIDNLTILVERDPGWVGSNTACGTVGIYISPQTHVFGNVDSIFTDGNACDAFTNPSRGGVGGGSPVDFSIAKTHDVATEPWMVGSTYTFTLDIAELGVGTDIPVVEDILQPGSTLVAVRNAGGDLLLDNTATVGVSVDGNGWNCTLDVAGGEFSFTAQEFSCIRDTAMPASTTDSLTVEVLVGNDAGPEVNNAAVVYGLTRGEPDKASAITPDSCWLGAEDEGWADNCDSDAAPLSGVDFEISKTHDSSLTYFYNNPITSTIIVTNNATLPGFYVQNATLPITVTDILPDPTTWHASQLVSYSGTGWTCTGNGDTTNGETVTCIYDELDGQLQLGDATAPLEIVWLPTDGWTTLTNVATVKGQDRTYANLATPDTVQDTVSMSRLTPYVTKTASPSTVVAGEMATYTVTFKSNQTSSAYVDIPAPVRITDTLPTGLSLQTLTAGSDWDCSASAGETVDCTYAPGGIIADFVKTTPESTVAIFVALVDQDVNAQQVINSAYFTGLRGYIGRSRESDSALINVVELADLSISKSRDIAEPTGSDILDYTVVITNSGPSSANDVVVTDLLPYNSSYVDNAGSDPAWNCAGDGNNPEAVTCTLTGTAPGSGANGGVAPALHIRVQLTPDALPGILNFVTISTSSPTVSNPTGSLSATDEATVITGCIGDYVWWDTLLDGTEEGVTAGPDGTMDTLDDIFGQPGPGTDGILGTADDGQHGFENVLMTLTDSNGNTITTTTDSSGFYSFDFLLLGTYTVTVDTATGTLVYDGQSLSMFDPTFDLDSGTTDPDSVSTASIADTGNPEDLYRKDVDFGYIQLGSIGDTIWHDENSDGIEGTNELGIPNVIVMLEDSMGNVITTTTSPTGTYLFDNLPMGAYTVTVDSGTVPAGKVVTPTGDPDSTPDGTSTTTLTPAVPDDLDQDFGYPPVLGSLGDTVFHDADGDGVYDPAAGDLPLENVILTLEYPDGTTVMTTTDASGYYTFTDLPLNQTYTVTVDTSSLPNGKDITPTGDSSQTADQTSEGTSTLSTTLTLANQDDPLLDFGFQPLGSLGDTVFHDADGDGVYDPAADDLPLENVMLTLEYPDGTTVMTTTDSTGYYSFEDLPLNATYTVTVDTSTIPNSKDTAPTGDPSNTADQTSEGTITLSTTLTSEDPTDPMLDFGFQPAGSLGDTVFHDADGDGVYDPAAGDLPLENVMLTLEYPDGTTVMTTTDSTGYYSFEDLPLNATYTVTVDTSTIPNSKDAAPTGDPSNTADQTSEGTITLSTTLTSEDPTDPMLDFGFQPAGSLGDTVFHDANGDGLFNLADGDLPLENVMLTLEYPDGTTVMTTTDSTGYYSFEDLPLNATYTVTVDTSTIPNSKDAAPTGDPSNTADQTSEGTITLSTTLTSEDPTDPMLDFGFQPLGSLGDTVFHDADGDGVYDPAAGDLPLENVMLTLEYPDGTTVMTTTDSTGYYSFEDLPLNATYTVTVDTSTIPNSKDAAPTGDPSNTADQTSEGTITLSTTLTSEDPTDPMLDFGFQPLGSLGDTVFHDADGDGVYDPAAGDLPLENVMLTLEYPDGTTVMTTTDSTGYYSFEDLPLNATYTVTVDTSTIPNSKDAAPTGDPSNTADQTSEGTITLSTTLTSEDPTDPMLDFGFQPAGSLGDTVFHDANGDGLFNLTDGDLPLENVMLTLEYPDGTTVMTTTDSTGYYSFEDLPLNATYTVTVDTSTIPNSKDAAPTGDPSNTADQTSEGTITLSTTLTSEDPTDPMLDFGFQPAGSLGDTVFHDANGDGLFNLADGDLPLENVMLTLEYPDGTTVMTTTDSTGYYSFEDLPLNATYTVTVDTSTIPNSKDAAPTGDPSNTADQTSEGTITLSTTLTSEDPTDPMLDFGFQPLGSLGDTVFHDADGDGVYDPAAGDLPLENVMLTLEYPDGTTVMTTTDSTGYYSFEDLPLNATYTVTVDTSTIPNSKDAAPTGDPSNTADQTSEGTITLSTTLTPSNMNDPMLDFGFQPLGSIGDTIWHDENSNGVQDGTEAGISGVTVTLVDSSGMTQTATTDGFGTYLFDDLPLGDYTVIVDTDDLPSGKQTTPSADPDGGADSTSTVSLTPNAPNNLDQDFAYPPVGSIGDTIFHDANGDGVMNATDGDFPLNGVDVLLSDAAGNLVATATTDVNGTYLFADLPLGDYVVTVDTSTLPATKLTVPTGDPDGGPGGIGDSTSAVSLTPENPDDRDQDFGYEPTPDAPTLGAIGDTIFHDADGDGIYEPNDGDFPLENVSVTLTDANGNMQTMMTDENGQYLFGSLPMGDYTITVDPATLPDGKQLNPSADPDDGADNTSMTTLTEEEPVDLDQDFGYEPEALGSIGDNIFHDRNGDGVYDPNDGDFPLDGVPVTLTDSNGNTWTTTTDAAGNYLFEDLPLDETYTVVVDTSGLVNKESAPSADPDGGADSTSMVTLTADDPNTPGDEANNRDQDFGYEPTPDAPTLGAIGDTIFHDANGDGVMNTADGDFPLENVSVTLTDANGNTQTMMTDENGQYLFGSLPMGDYTVTVDPSTLPDGKVLNPSADPDGGADNTSMTTLTEEEPVDLDQDFGYEPEALGSIGDLIFHDRNGDGVYDPNDGDFPLEGITVTLTDENGNTQSTTTNASGEYLFTDLPLDAMYTVMVDTSGLVNKENAPSADPDGGADSVSVVNLTQNAPDNRDQDFGYEPTPDAPTLGAIGDTIFHDADGDGIYEPGDGDFPLPGVSVTLTGPNDPQMAVTDENGQYIFTDLPLGDYTVTVDTATLPDGKQMAPSADPDGSADSTSAVRLTEETPVDLDQDFGYEPDAVGSIGDLIFHDANGDGVYDPAAGDFPLPGITVTLTDAAGNTQTATTDAMGNYLFEDLPLNASYTVVVDTSDLPSGKITAPSADPDGGADSTSVVMLTDANPDDRAQDFGYQPDPDAPIVGSIGDTIWHDANSDGLYNSADGDLPLAGITVTLTDASGATQTAVTDENGNYLFANLPMGDYTVLVDTSGLPASKNTTPTGDPDGGPGGIGDSTSAVSLTPENPVDLDQDFGYESAGAGSIGDTIFHDANGDGLFNPADGDFPLPTVTVMLTDSGGNTQTATTDINGNYLFENLPLGEYTVLVDTTTLPGGKVTIPSADPDSGPGGIGDSTSVVMLTSVAPNNLDQDFGYEQDPVLASLGNYFWIDTDKDGLFDPDEAPVVGGEVLLYNIDGVLVESVLTDDSGFFSFAAPAGDYYLEFVPPPGYSFTQPNFNDGPGSDADPRTGQTQTITLQAGTHDPEWGAGIIIAPTAVNLSSFTVELRNESELVVRWATSTEFDTAGFHILRSTDGRVADARQITTQLVPSQGSAGGSYEVVLPYDETVQPPLSMLTFWLYEMELDAAVNYYGPVTVTVDAAEQSGELFLPLLVR